MYCRLRLQEHVIITVTLSRRDVVAEDHISHGGGYAWHRNTCS